MWRAGQQDAGRMMICMLYIYVLQQRSEDNMAAAGVRLISLRGKELSSEIG